MSPLPCWPREERLPASEVLNRALELCVQGDFRAFSDLVDRHHATVLAAYDDFFFVGTEINHVEEFLLKLVQLDVHKTDEWVASVHMRYLRNLRSFGHSAQTPVRVICEHYGREYLQTFLDKFGTTACGHDPTFRSNTSNFLMAAMRPVVEDSHEEQFAVQLVQIYVENGADADARYKTDGGQSAVHYAASNNLWDCVELLMKKQAAIDLVYEGGTARQVIMDHRPELLLKYNYPVPQTSESYEITDSLFRALYNNDEIEFKKLYLNARNSNFYFSEDDGWNTLLQLASRKNLKDSVGLILDSGVYAYGNSELKDPPILLAAENGHFEIVLQLVSYQLDANGDKLFGAAHVEVTGDHGDTVLHKCARALSQVKEEERLNEAIETIMQIIDVLGKRGELDINARNLKSETPFKLFMESNSKILFNFLLKKGAFLGVDKSIMNDIHYHDLQNMLDSTVSSEVNSKGYKIVNMDFECFHLRFKNVAKELESKITCDTYPEMLTLYKISKSHKHTNLLSHPLVTSFLNLKWLKIYWIYFINLILFSCFVVSLTTYVCYATAFNPRAAPMSKMFTVIFWAYILAREIIQVLMSPLQYFKIFENWLHILIVVLTSILITYGPNESVTFLILATYSEFSLLLGRHPNIAKYIAMFVKVSKVNILLLAISLPFLFSFAICFSILFKTEHGNSMFINPISSLFKTLVMATGEFDFSDLEFELKPVVSEIIFILFVISIEVILMNLLHALAVHDTEGIQRDAEIVSIQAKIELYTKIESAWLGYPMDWYENKWGVTSKPNKLLMFWHKFIVQLRSVIRISVLPLPDNLKFCISIREDGKILENIAAKDIFDFKDNVTLKFFPGSSWLRPVIRLISGVNLQKMFMACHEYVVNVIRNESEDRIHDEVKDLRREIQNIRREVSEIKCASERQNDVLQELKNLIIQQNSTLQNLSRTMQTVRQS